MSCETQITQNLRMGSLRGAIQVEGIDYMGYPVYHVPATGEIFYEADFERPVTPPEDVERAARARIPAVCQG